MSKQSELVEAIMELNSEGDDWDAKHLGELVADWHKKHELQARIDELNSLPHRSVTALTGSVDQSVIYERLDELKKELERIEADD